ncbi:hypothetical protein FKR81_14760 [Lentzea tibetensis]|uniref:Lipoprotein n=1 Tax=Lentzea tibetensis TaxID=2591470 RepID=A0A563EVF4_9PSEU|nr:hypothetical protein [Lentzea tibetensis]TWP51471.1 hypothetical protein FKR81_14760 [Lentzea tibetensis]
MNHFAIRAALLGLAAAVLLAGCVPQTARTGDDPVTAAPVPPAVDEVWGEGVTVDGEPVPYFSAKCDANGEPFDVKPPWDSRATAAARRVCQDGEAGR